MFNMVIMYTTIKQQMKKKTPLAIESGFICHLKISAELTAFLLRWFCDG